MVKQILKIISFLFIFSLFVGNIFALSAELKIDKESYNTNDYINLVLEIESKKSGEIKIKNIKNLDKFDIISQSQSQSSRTNIVAINGKTKSENISKISLNLVLKAKQNGEFEIGPAVLQSGTGTIESNSVNIKIDGSNLNILQNNNSNNIIPKKNNKEKNIKKIEKINNDISNNIDLKNYKSNNYELYILLLVLVLSSLGFYFLLKKNIKNENIKKSSISKNIKKGPIIKNRTAKITYPKTEESDFIEKINTIFKKKLGDKFELDNIENLTSKEIMEKIPKNSKLEEISDLLNKAKYSGNSLDNKKILELVKNI